MNPLYQMMQNMPMFGVTGTPMAGGPMAQLPKLMQLFNSFSSGFRGNPEQIVRQLMSSGRMSQEQFNQLSQAATQFQQMTGVK